MPDIFITYKIFLILYIGNDMAKSDKSDIVSVNFITLTEQERLKRDIFRPDMEKLQLFTQMLRTNKLLKRAVIRHK